MSMFIKDSRTLSKKLVWIPLDSMISVIRLPWLRLNLAIILKPSRKTSDTPQLPLRWMFTAMFPKECTKHLQITWNVISAKLRNKGNLKGNHKTKIPRTVAVQGIHVAEKEGFEPSIPFWGIHDFQSCALGRTTRLLHGARLIVCCSVVSLNIIICIDDKVKPYFHFFHRRRQSNAERPSAWVCSSAESAS